MTVVLERAGMSVFLRVGSASANPIHFRKYRVAPRLGTDLVRRRLLRGLHARATLTATQTGMA